MEIGYTAAESILARARTAFRRAMETVFGSSTPQLMPDIRSSAE